MEQTFLPTYSFEEAIERISMCTDRWELKMLAELLEEEKKRYSIYHLKLICHAVDIMFDVVHA